MKTWKGTWIMFVAIIHLITTCLFLSDTLYKIIQLGIFNSIGKNFEIGLVAWSILFGMLLFICGLLISTWEKKLNDKIPRHIGWCLLAMITFGLILMPISGFWLALPPSMAITIQK